MKNCENKIALVTQLFVWSVVLEPLLIFTLTESSQSGFTPNISKLLQISVIVILIVNCMLRGRFISLPTFSAPEFKPFKYFIILTVFSGFIGYISGAYTLPTKYDLSFTNYSSFSATINSAEIRPVIEYFVLLYYFSYFVVLPKYLLNNRQSIEYFFDKFALMFYLCIILGLIDYIFGLFGILFLPRHFGEEFVTTGLRFHGLAGEPRDSFVYLILGSSVMYLRSIITFRPINRIIYPIVFICLLLTESASGMVGVMIFGALYPFFCGKKLTANKFIKILIFYSLVTGIMILVFQNIDRLNQYLNDADGLWDILESGSDIPYLMFVQMVNIYPLYNLTVKFRDFNFLPLLIGSGLGSASAINNYIPGGLKVLSNPHSQLVRILYESGIIGFILYVRIFIVPIKYLSKSIDINTYTMQVLMLLVLAACFGHRSSSCYIFLGIFIAATKYSKLNTLKSQRFN